MAIASFEYDYCYVTVDLETGFACIRDIWNGLEMWEADSLEEALECLSR